MIRGMETHTNVSIPVKKRHPLFKWILVVGIMIVANLFINYALDAFYPAPKFETFCPQSQIQEAVVTKAACVARGGQWTESTYPVASGLKPVSAPVRRATLEVTGSCDVNYTCQKGFDAAQKLYDRNVFIVLVIAGTILLISGIFISSVEVVALGSSFAGVLSLIIGTIRHWSNMNEYAKVVVLGFALAALVWLGVKKFKDN